MKRKSSMILGLIITLLLTISVSLGTESAFAATPYETAKANGTPSPYGHIVVTIGNTLPIRDGGSMQSMDLMSNGQLIQRRYFDIEGKVDMDIDYTNHGNPAQHPVVPHRHNWSWPNGIFGNPVRGPWY